MVFFNTEGQTDRRTDGQKERHTEGQAHRRTDTQKDRHTEGQTGGHTNSILNESPHYPIRVQAKIFLYPIISTSLKME